MTAHARIGLTSARGFMLLEVLMVSAILGITLVGLALFLGRSQGFAVGESDERAALYLAEQMIEQQAGQLRAGTRPTDVSLVCVNTTATPPNCSNFSTTQYSQTACAPGDTDPACTSFTLTTGVGWSATQAGTPLGYKRLTCIQWVNDTTLLHGTDGTPSNDCPCTGPGTTSLTKRVCVKVTSKKPEARAVILRTVLTSQPAS